MGRAPRFYPVEFGNHVARVIGATRPHNDVPVTLMPPPNWKPDKVSAGAASGLRHFYDEEGHVSLGDVWEDVATLVSVAVALHGPQLASVGQLRAVSNRAAYLRDDVAPS